MTRAQLKKAVLDANLLLHRERLALLTWGNASACDRQKGYLVIKPSGVPYPRMKPTDMSVVDLDGKQIEGRYRPSSDLETHLAIYRAFPSVGGVVHTHSTYATAWAQAGLDLPAEGTTHADHFRGAVPCTRALRPEEISGDYEAETGKMIVETFLERQIDPAEVAAVLVRNHGPFTWGSTANDAAHNAVVLEEVARMALLSRQIGSPRAISRELLDKHFLRKHGPGAYYGQR